MKTCPDCGQLKPLVAFGLNKRQPDGRARYCKECFSARSRASYRKRQQQVGKTVREPRDVPPGLKWCPDCDTIKPYDEFCSNKRTKSGRATYCKECHNARSREVRERLYGGGREYHLRARYGIGQTHVDAMLEAQGGVCAVCGKLDPEHVDHDRESRAVRGMLCFNCNQALGNTRDDVGVLNGLIDYLDNARAEVAPLIPHQEIRFVGVEVDFDPDGAWHRREPQHA